jgi:hypothetical protein
VVAGTLRVPLSQQQKRRIQPERYVPLVLGCTFELVEIKIIRKNGSYGLVYILVSGGKK